VEDRQPAPGLLWGCWERLLDGRRRWGSIDIRPDRFGVTRYQLVVYPPGISVGERRRLRLWRGWPLWGALLWVVSEIAVSQVTGPWTALAISIGAYLGSGAAAFVAASDVRPRVRTMAAMLVTGHYEPTSRATCERLQTLAATLVAADERLDRGQISAIDHEMAWWTVYSQMATAPTEAHRSGGSA
jgi:hypothetical protein